MKKIEGFLYKAGFSRTKDSEYVSDWKMSKADAYQLLAKMVEKMPWIATSYDAFNMYSVKGEIKISEVIRQSDILHSKIKKLIDNPPGQNRGLSSAKKQAEAKKQVIQPEQLAESVGEEKFAVFSKNSQGENLNGQYNIAFKEDDQKKIEEALQKPKKPKRRI